MAQTTQDTTVFSDSTGQEVKEQAVESKGGGVEVAVVGQTDEGSPPIAAVAPVEKAGAQTWTDAQSTEPPPRPSLTPLGSTHTQSSTLTPVAPHPKRFSAVNINKKFLEKNTASGSAAASSTSSTTKSGSPSTRPSAPPTSSHSRLVTAKLTANPAVTSSTAGWSRPSSVAPSTAGTSSPISTSPLPTTPATQLSTTAAPQLPHVGKVILPQPRAAMTQLVSQKEPSAIKPVWGNIKPPTASSARLDIQTEDFPTAAEVAHNTLLNSKVDEAKATTETAKQLRSEEADTFRGVHLDPNAHHWDEEEDDDNFLDGVIEFGDGRQYKIESNEQTGASGSQGPRPQTGDSSAPSVPVSKEERFVDDFDRSWPKSRPSPTTTPRDFPSPAQQSASLSVSPVISHASHDSSRVLFNERSNRLEPYSQSHRPGQGPFGAKRSGYQEGSGPVESRHTPHNIQVLQKGAPGDSRSRRFSSSNNAGPVNGFVGDRNHRRDVPPHSPRLTRDLPPHTADRDWESERGRRTSMGPPPIPSHAIKQESGRQIPPHLSQISPNIPARRLSSRDSRFSPSEPSAGLPPSSGRLPPHSPAISHSSLSLVSPAATSNIPLPLSAPELDEVRKDVMHTAAERAKQRRQQEEAEREAQKERARRKAAEIEEKMKASEIEKHHAKGPEEADKSAKEKEAIVFIEAAIKGVEVTSSIEEKKAAFKHPTRPPPLKPSSPAQSIVESLQSATFVRCVPPRSVPPNATTPGTQAPSWRARSNPPPPATPNPSMPRQIQSRPSTSTHFIPSTPSAAERIETIADESKDELEVVDFSDMGKFVGVHEEAAPAIDSVPEEKTGHIPLLKPSRPVASDFFDKPAQVQDNIPETTGFGAWRRKVSQDVNEPVTRPPNDVKLEVVDNLKQAASQVQIGASLQDHSEPIKQVEPAAFVDGLASPREHHDQSHGPQAIQSPSNSHLQRTPRAPTFYKETNMSALDDAMSRIKGVLVGMHAHEPTQEVVLSNGATQEPQLQRPVQKVQTPAPQTPVRAPKDRWVPPALRPRRFDEHDEPREVFLYTVIQLPPSPKALSVVRLPIVSRPVDSIYRKQLNLFCKPPYQARMDILSFDPPVPDMNRRNLSLNDVLFDKPPAPFKAKIKYRVSLPRLRGGPKVSMPIPNNARPNGGGAFGRPTVADGASTWRKPAASSAVRSDFSIDVSGLDTTSRSPPPDHTPPESAIASIPKASESSPSKSDTNSSTRPRSQPKMPEGSAVAFIRDSRIDVVEADTKPLVNFIVGSQLEDASPASEVTAPIVANGFSEANKPAVNGVLTTAVDKEHVSSAGSTTDESKNPEDSTDQILVTPPTHHSSASWTRSSVSLTAKDSPARAPDPEHLKAVWSQSSDKAGLHAVNSLEGIADDPLPFLLQDVKSEDGETPPPSIPTAPSRMSLQDVAKAFQTVPTSSSANSQQPHRATFSPPSTQAPVARPTPATPAYAYSPLPQNNMRPSAYVSYSSPMMSHSPAPVMYGHPMASSPVPSRMQMNGHTPLYSQPMWVTMPPSQNHGNMIRPSPYPTQMMGYPSSGYAPQPPPNMMPGTPTAQNGSRGRAMYGSSPVMLHAVQVPQNQGYIPIAAGRGQPRTDNGQMPGQQQHVVQHPASHSGFNAGPTPSFRPQW
ncbi:hypothetical protein BDN70DRAFT_397207 [Pholiota conissans]|uniref:Uncharacterized protein n=1 Tax=Pholiota conissans TaxID=109636 RepID=A0A9P5YRF4_9AGAR|nr:hypothetical protein BDN70DRAFT_397207 [Pholiota conissans]